MGKIIDLFKFHKQNDIDGAIIHQHVYKNMTTHIPYSVYTIIDNIMAEIWNNTISGSVINKYDVMDIITNRLALQNYIIGYNNVSQIVELIFEKLEQMGQIER